MKGLPCRKMLGGSAPEATPRAAEPLCEEETSSPQAWVVPGAAACDWAWERDGDCEGKRIGEGFDAGSDGKVGVLDLATVGEDEEEGGGPKKGSKEACVGVARWWW